MTKSPVVYLLKQISYDFTVDGGVSLYDKGKVGVKLDYFRKSGTCHIFGSFDHIDC